MCSFREATVALNLAEEAYCFLKSICSMDGDDMFAYLSRDDIPVKHEDIIAYSMCLWAPKCGFHASSIWQTVRFDFISDTMFILLQILLKSDDYEERLREAEELNAIVPGILNIFLPVGNMQFIYESRKAVARALDDRARSRQYARSRRQVYPPFHHAVSPDLSVSRVPRHSYQFTLSTDLINYCQRGCGIFFIWLDPKNPLAPNAIRRKGDEVAEVMPSDLLMDNGYPQDYSGQVDATAGVLRGANGMTDGPSPSDPDPIPQRNEGTVHHLPERYVQNIQEWGKLYSVMPHVFNGRQCFLATQQANVWLKWNQSVLLHPNNSKISRTGTPPSVMHPVLSHTPDKHDEAVSVSYTNVQVFDLAAVTDDKTFEDTLSSIKVNLNHEGTTSEELGRYLEVRLGAQLRPSTRFLRRMVCLRWMQHIHASVAVSSAKDEYNSPNHRGNDNLKGMSMEVMAGEKDYLTRTYLALAESGRWIELCDIARLCILWLFGPGSLYIDLDFTPGTATFPLSFLSREFPGEVYDWTINGVSLDADHKGHFGSHRYSKLMLGKDAEGLLQNNFLLLPLTSHAMEPSPPSVLYYDDSPLPSPYGDHSHSDSKVVYGQQHPQIQTVLQDATPPGMQFLEVVLHAVANSARSEFNPLYATGPVFLTTMYYALKDYSLSPDSDFESGIDLDTPQEEGKEENTPGHTIRSYGRHSEEPQCPWRRDVVNEQTQAKTLGDADIGSNTPTACVPDEELYPPRLERMPLDPLFSREFTASGVVTRRMKRSNIAEDYHHMRGREGAQSPHGWSRTEDLIISTEPSPYNSDDDADFLHILPTACLFPYHWTEKSGKEKDALVQTKDASQTSPSKQSKPPVVETSRNREVSHRVEDYIDTAQFHRTDEVTNSTTMNNDRTVTSVPRQGSRSTPDIEASEATRRGPDSPSSPATAQRSITTGPVGMGAAPLTPERNTVRDSTTDVDVPGTNLNSKNHVSSPLPLPPQSLSIWGIDLAALLEETRQANKRRPYRKGVGSRRKGNKRKRRTRRKSRGIIASQDKSTFFTDHSRSTSSETNTVTDNRILQQGDASSTPSVPHYGTHSWDTSWAPSSSGYEAYAAPYGPLVDATHPHQDISVSLSPVEFDIESYNTRALRQTVASTMDRLRNWLDFQALDVPENTASEIPEWYGDTDQEVSPTVHSTSDYASGINMKRAEVEILLSEVEDALMYRKEQLGMDWDVSELCQAFGRIIGNSQDAQHGADLQNTLVDLSILLKSMIALLRSKSNDKTMTAMHLLRNTFGTSDTTESDQQSMHTTLYQGFATNGVFACCHCRFSGSQARMKGTGVSHIANALSDLPAQMKVLRSFRNKLLSRYTLAKQYLAKYAPLSTSELDAPNDTEGHENRSRYPNIVVQSDASQHKGRYSCICYDTKGRAFDEEWEKRSRLEKSKWLQETMKCELCKQACVYLTLVLHLLFLLYFSHFKEATPSSYNARLKSLELALVQGKSGEYTPLVREQLKAITADVWKKSSSSHVVPDSPLYMFNFLGMPVPSSHPYLKEYCRQMSSKAGEDKYDILYVMPESTYQDKYGCLSLAFRIAKRMRRQDHIIPDNTLLKFWSNN